MEAGSAPGLPTSRLTDSQLFNGPVSTQSPYDQAREYINDFTDSQPGANITLERYENFERHFSIQIDSIEWGRLYEDLDLENADEISHIKASYNSSTSTLAIKAMSSPLHELIVGTFAVPFYVLESSLPIGSDGIFTATNLKVRDFEGIYQGSQKVPDAIVEFLNPAGVSEGTLVVEVGFSETYSDLMQDVRMWLEGKPNVNVAVIVKVNETPEYRCSIKNLDDQRLDSGEVPDFQIEGDYGPVTHDGSIWVGSVSETYIEAWGRDPETGLISRIRDRIDLHTSANPPNLEFQLSDFVHVTPEDDRRITIGWERYMQKIKPMVMRQAVWRYQGLLCRLRKERAEHRLRKEGSLQSIQKKRA
ncbi:MAG: hypothetical protein M1840_002372 [Geoglossum simile]|nr:MAG: hypothetical protein M1840_002372 [Geoglossum simile]